jgi:hypothetical protein
MIKKGQGQVALYILLGIVIILIIGMMFLVVSVSGPSATIVDNPNEEIYIEEVQTQTPIETFSCNSPYIKVGRECCLDSNTNKICDKDETINKPQENTITTNVIECRESRISSSDLDFPFDIKSFKVYRDEIKFSLKNQAGYNIIIKNIEIDDCDEIEPEVLILTDKEKKFSIDCDFNYGRLDLNIDVTYLRLDNNMTETSSGEILGFIERNTGTACDYI